MKTYNKILKNPAYLLMVGVVFSMILGCKDFLDTTKQGEYTSDNYPYPGGSGPYDEYLFGAYNDLRSYDMHCRGFFLATSVRSDDADKGSSPTDGGADALTMDNFPVAPNNGAINELWKGHFAIIIKCNIALDQIANNTGITASEDQKLLAQAEARCLRGYAYFNLVRFFGRVPLIDKVLSADQPNTAQVGPDQLYPFIENDLQFAAANLPVNWDRKFVGRLTKGVANGLLAKVYLTQQKWGAAMSAANMVMTSGQYDLSMSYSSIFGESGENGKESVFEVQATASAAVPTANGAEITQWQGVRGPGDWNLGYGFNVPNNNLSNAYEPNDPRKARTFLYRSDANNTYKTVYGENTGTTWENPIYNHKVYTNPTYRALYNNRAGRWMNIRLLRYADVVLMYAEAANEVGGTGNTTEALKALNSVRARARIGAPAGTLPDITTTDQGVLREAIRHERRIELAMEYDRFFDLVRWGISGSVLPAAGRPNFVAARDNLLPIPQAQIDLSKEPYKLTQNPLYN
ncbi:RagB/SusD domain protein [Pseudopedobacter saltans DSM 12145]|uniref:RagB/SusD domain protein n=1 Tax=Pseudopedobacter saltans (strain ATCC 51119 / DSM 12145 / JCM 21818 / CCUG 39354 / LMG 10337 / NBRC 100064 / NCIMB 13643) TaxID=762903 RepID=F0SBN3_PSESL|nr:RagB/SusD family nutrient uptake outer membrane protein [Pseudopedobacter saltans]ADY52724.1 RagB/SusD domain protein [Pseudopedobacter saltans DSM 12145]